MHWTKGMSARKSALYYALQFLILAYLLVVSFYFIYLSPAILEEWGVIETGGSIVRTRIILGLCAGICVTFGVLVAWLAETELSRRFGYRSSGDDFRP